MKLILLKVCTRFLLTTDQLSAHCI